MAQQRKARRMAYIKRHLKDSNRKIAEFLECDEKTVRNYKHEAEEGADESAPISVVPPKITDRAHWTVAEWEVARKQSRNANEAGFYDGLSADGSFNKQDNASVEACAVSVAAVDDSPVKQATQAKSAARAGGE